MSGKQKDLAKLCVDGKTLDLPIVEGSEGERGISLAGLRKQTNLVTYDPGFANTGACKSSITYIDGEEGILRYRGYSIEELARKCSFVEVSYLLVHNKLPTAKERKNFGDLLNQHSLIHEDMRHYFSLYPENSHPMAILSAMVVSLSSFYPELELNEEEEIDITVTRLLSKLRTIAAYCYKKFIGHPIIYPCEKYSYCANFLNMMFQSPVRPYKMDPVMVKAMNQLLILHADHEQNCSASVVRMVGSTGANLYASIAAGIGALWGPLHGGANQQVIEMLKYIQNEENGNLDKVMARAKDKSDPFRLMGFGHRVYKTYDPRARVAKKLCHEVLDHLGIEDPLLDLAQNLEERAVADPYFVERGLYPNVDFYTGIIYRAMGIPTNMFTVMFALGRVPGWIAQWQEMRNDPNQRIGRPRQIYTGPLKRDLVAIENR